MPPTTGRVWVDGDCYAYVMAEVEDEDKDGDVDMEDEEVFCTLYTLGMARRYLGGITEHDRE